jgi:hypothetical protein
MGKVKKMDTNGKTSAQTEDAALRTERAINVLRERAEKSTSQAHPLTSTSAGVMINYARELVRRAS